jgi:pSer/pThr/pTyr-binding forkhead associated (FHA) protein
MRCPACQQLLRLVMAREAMLKSPLALLVVERGPALVGTVVYLAGDKPIAFGSDERAVLRLPDPTVGAVHGTLEPSGRSWRVIDSQSVSGVIVNKKRVVAQVLEENDLVQIGPFLLRYHTVGPLRDGTKKAAPAGPSASPAKPAAPTPPPAKSSGGTTSAAGLTFLHDAEHAEKAEETKQEQEFRFADDEDVFPTKPAPVPGRPPGVSPTCPQCKQQLPPEARICVACGIDLETGRSLLEGRGAVIETADKPGREQKPRRGAAAREGVSPGGMGSLSAYLKDCAAAFAFFVKPLEFIKFFILVVLLALASASGLLGCFGLPLILLVNGLYFGFLFSTVENAASGDRDLPELSLADGFIGAIVMIFKFLGVSFIASAPLVIYAGVTGQMALDSKALAADPWLVLLVALGVLSWPMVVLAVAMGGLGALGRPDLMIVTIARTFQAYMLVVTLAAVATVATGFVQEGADALATKIGMNDYAVGAILRLLDAYCAVIAMQAIGLYYHHFKPRFAWSWG